MVAAAADHEVTRIVYSRATTRMMQPREITLTTSVKSARAVIEWAPPEDVADFSFLVQDKVSCQYPGTEPEYGVHLFQQHLGSTDVTGSTSSRSVWRLVDDSGKSLGYAATATKADGCVKVGPIALVPGVRRAGLGHQMLGALESYYRSIGTRQLYATIPAVNRAMALVSTQCGWSTVARIPGLYRTDSELLVNKHLGNQSSSAHLNVRLKQAPPAAPHFMHHRLKRGGSALIVVPDGTSLRTVGLYGRKISRSNSVGHHRIAYALLATADARQLMTETYRLDANLSIVVWRR